jgi:endonuclease/exonuclease/phosphatase family metal-dependent hydrolase
LIRRVVRLVTLPLALVLAGLLATPAEAAPRPVKVMTRNLYLGADLDPAIRATTIPDLLAATSHIFSVVHQTDFPARAKVLAREIADADPALVSLQEAAMWFSGPLNDPAPAGHVEYDFLASLRAELAAVGRPYDVVGVQPEADIEAPAGAPYFADIRLLQRDAILVRAGSHSHREIKLAGVRSANFVHRFEVTTGTGQTVAVNRGWVAVDAMVNKRAFRLVATHLEAFHPGVRLEQAQELLAPSGPIGSARGPAVLAGDLNSGPDLPVPADRLAFQALAGAGLVDTWAVANPGDPGYTAGFGELLTDPGADGVLQYRVDHVLATAGVGVVRSRITGTDPDDRTPSGLWPSDHAGVVATLTP